MAKKGGYGFGIVGCGMVADFHAQAIAAMKGGHLAGVFSRKSANARRVAKKYGCAAYTDYKAFLAHPGLDIVTIATPSGAHLEPVEKAAAAGKHIACEKPLEVCMHIAPVEGVFDNPRVGRKISKEEAYNLLRKSEEEGLVHLTWNVQSGHFFICNCCGCCCEVLRPINERGIPASTVVYSGHYADIDSDACVACGTCADERCQVNAIEEGEEAYRVIGEKCIGCGLCLTTCPSEALQLVRKEQEKLVAPPLDERAWYEERGRQRGVDFSNYK